MLRYAALLYGHHSHSLDHLGVLSCLLRIPLIVTEPEVERLAKRYYPDIELQLLSSLTANRDIVSKYDAVLTTLPRPLIDEIFFLPQHQQNKRLITIWCPHGSSDKGQKSGSMQALEKDHLFLLYGERMLKTLKALHPTTFYSIIAGNYRYHYWQQHRDFYDKLMEKMGINKTKKRMLLYAPTWQDFENNCSFDALFFPLVDQLPSHYNLIIKLHPNFVRKNQEKLQPLVRQYADKENLRIVLDFSPIYPLLANADLYVGDMSSIGFDYLHFNRPMFFFDCQHRKWPEGLFLHRCGMMIPDNALVDLYNFFDLRFLENDVKYHDLRRELYTETFAPFSPCLKKEVEKKVADYLEDNLNLLT